MNVTFERATEDDAEKLVEVQIAAFHDDTRLYGVPPGGPPGYDSVEAMRDLMTTLHVYKIVHEGEIVGGIIVGDEGNGHFHLDVLNIHPDYHNRGIGTRAMQFIEQAHPATRWTLDTPLYATRNQHFYEKLGYVKTGEHDAHGLVLLAYEKRA